MLACKRVGAFQEFMGLPLGAPPGRPGWDYAVCQLTRMHVCRWSGMAFPMASYPGLFIGQPM